MNILPNILFLGFSTQEVEICIIRLVLAGRRETRVWQVQTIFEQDMMCFKSVWNFCHNETFLDILAPNVSGDKMRDAIFWLR